jgi:type VI secretion system protein VasJ
VELLELGKTPVSEAAPTGAPSRDDPLYEGMQAEFRKLELPDMPAVDWDGVIRSASQFLETKSKDVMAGVYLAIALFERDGYDGLQTGLTVVHDLVSNYWDTLNPERARPRQTAFQFLSAQCGKRVVARGADGATRRQIQAIVGTAVTLDTFLSQKLEGGADLLSELLRETREIESQVHDEPVAAPASATPPPSSSSSSAPAPPSGPISSEQEYDAAVQAVRPALRAMGAYRRGTTPKDPLAYRLPRIALWMAVKQAPPSSGGATEIPAPQPADSLSQLEAKLAAQQWAGVLEESEGRMTNATFWLDLHYFAHAALRGMGPEFFPAADAVAGEVRLLVQRMPELPGLSFAGGMPLASPATQDWIRDVLAAPGGGGGARSGGGMTLALAAESGEPEGLAEARAQSAALVAAGKLGEAVRLFEAGAARAVRARERAAWKVAIAAVCAEASRHDVALAQLEALHEELQETRLEEWDPELASAMLRLTLAARQKVVAGNAAPEEQKATRELLRRLARLDAAAALEIQRPAQ